ncbi:hypothetical protein MIMGU_mgv1a024747mg, partial [Erythranthe guttata]
MYWQRQGLCCLILAQHCPVGLPEDDIAAAHGLSCTGLQFITAADPATSASPSTTAARTAQITTRYATLVFIISLSVFSVCVCGDGEIC